MNVFEDKYDMNKNIIQSMRCHAVTLSKKFALT